MAASKSKNKKIVPLKTVANLKVDLELTREELTQAREVNNRLSFELARTKHGEREQTDRVRDLFVTIRNLVRTTKSAPLARLPLSTRFMTMIFPKFALQQAVLLARAEVWAQIVQRLNEFTFETHHGDVPETKSQTKATTIHIERED